MALMFSLQISLILTTFSLTSFLWTVFALHYLNNRSISLPVDDPGLKHDGLDVTEQEYSVDGYPISPETFWTKVC